MLNFDLRIWGLEAVLEVVLGLLITSFSRA